MKKLSYFILFLLSVSVFGCNDMNDNIKEYLDKGEIIYIGRVDSMFTYGGNNRFKFEFWVSDPRATEVEIFWSQRTSSAVIPIPKDRNIAEPIELIVGKNDNGTEVTEGTYTLQVEVRDSHNNRSVMDEINVSVYGEKFQKQSTPRIITSAAYNASNATLTIKWGGSTTAREVGNVVYYVDKSGTPCELYVESANLKTTVIKEFDTTQPVGYQTLFMPEETAIDTFYSVRKDIVITGLP